MSNGFKKKGSFRCRQTTRKRTSFACETRRRTANHVGSGRSGPNAPPPPPNRSRLPAQRPPVRRPPARRPGAAAIRTRVCGSQVLQSAGVFPKPPGRVAFSQRHMSPRRWREPLASSGCRACPWGTATATRTRTETNRAGQRAPNSLPGRFKMTCSERAQGDPGFTDAAPAARAASFALHLLARVACEMSWRGSPRH